MLSGSQSSWSNLRPQVIQKTRLYPVLYPACGEKRSIWAPATGTTNPPWTHPSRKRRASRLRRLNSGDLSDDGVSIIAIVAGPDKLKNHATEGDHERADQARHHIAVTAVRQEQAQAGREILS